MITEQSPLPPCQYLSARSRPLVPVEIGQCLRHGAERVMFQILDSPDSRRDFNSKARTLPKALSRYADSRSTETNRYEYQHLGPVQKCSVLPLLGLHNLLCTVQAGEANHVLSHEVFSSCLHGSSHAKVSCCHLHRSHLVDVNIGAVQLGNEQIHQQDGRCQDLGFGARVSG